MNLTEYMYDRVENIESVKNIEQAVEKYNHWRGPARIYVDVIEGQAFTECYKSNEFLRFFEKSTLLNVASKSEYTLSGQTSLKEVRKDLENQLFKGSKSFSLQTFDFIHLIAEKLEGEAETEGKMTLLTDLKSLVMPVFLDKMSNPIFYFTPDQFYLTENVGYLRSSDYNLEFFYRFSPNNKLIDAFLKAINSVIEKEELKPRITEYPEIFSSGTGLAPADDFEERLRTAAQKVDSFAANTYTVQLVNIANQPIYGKEKNKELHLEQKEFQQDLQELENLAEQQEITITDRIRSNFQDKSPETRKKFLNDLKSNGVEIVSLFDEKNQEYEQDLDLEL